MDFLDNAIDVAKETFQIVSQKTSEVITAQKQKYNIASLTNKRSKDFQKLGQIYYNLIKNTDIQDETTKSIVEEIVVKDNEINRLKDELNAALNQKVCPYCNANIDKASVFCSSCGTKVDNEE